MTASPLGRRHRPRRTAGDGPEPAAVPTRSQPTVRTRAGVLFRGAGERPGVLVELIALVLWFVLFVRLDAAVGRDVVAATANALTLQSAEHAMHLDIEREVNGWLAGSPGWSRAAVCLYRLYYVAVAGVLLWVLLRHAGVYRKVRRTMVAMMALVLPVYWSVPMSPPRLALPGAADLVARYDILGEASRESWTNPSHFTAMPSMHVGWSLWCGYAMWCALRGAHPRAALLVWLFPLLMAADVLATGNHYLLDVAGSVALLAVSVVAATASRWLTARRSIVKIIPVSSVTDRCDGDSVG
ncbi:phosphatase PAP2 family protein [Actinoplanes cyaneus]|uniref:phosphatase PAP2 family protein n=1 Tax=Actinoplanes cyaneus TaxID=52696 RepID=UPI001EF3CCDF|nr:phosphatase PAP2 family protein [Actinoplanes cyaneus]